MKRKTKICFVGLLVIVMASMNLYSSDRDDNISAPQSSSPWWYCAYHWGERDCYYSYWGDGCAICSDSGSGGGGGGPQVEE